MTDEEIKLKIIKIFQDSRKNKNDFFEETHFLDFLASPPFKKGTIKNSFKGARKYYNFMDKLELEFRICFKIQDLDNLYSVDQLTKKVKERINKRSGNTKILKERIKENKSVKLEATLITIYSGLVFWIGVHWMSILLTILLVIILAWLISARIHNYKHVKNLSNRFKSNNT